MNFYIYNPIYFKVLYRSLVSNLLTFLNKEKKPAWFEIDFHVKNSLVFKKINRIKKILFLPELLKSFEARIKFEISPKLKTSKAPLLF